MARKNKPLEPELCGNIRRIFYSALASNFLKEQIDNNIPKELKKMFISKKAEENFKKREVMYTSTNSAMKNLVISAIFSLSREN